MSVPERCNDTDVFKKAVEHPSVTLSGLRHLMRSTRTEQPDDPLAVLPSICWLQRSFNGEN